MLRGVTASLRRLKEAYAAWTSVAWPHDDSYLRELTREADTQEELLLLMRETHTIEETKPGESEAS